MGSVGAALWVSRHVSGSHRPARLQHDVNGTPYRLPVHSNQVIRTHAKPGKLHIFRRLRPHPPEEGPDGAAGDDAGAWDVRNLHS